MECTEVKRKLYAAYNKLLRNDRVLLELDVNECSVTHKLAEYLQSESQEWHVDCEYIRDVDVPKQMKVQRVSTDDEDAHTVFPDVIVHQRNTKNNLVVIEAKKSNSFRQSNDREKLKAYIAENHYQVAFTVVFPVKSCASEANSLTDITEVTA